MTVLGGVECWLPSDLTVIISHPFNWIPWDSDEEAVVFWINVCSPLGFTCFHWGSTLKWLGTWGPPTTAPTHQSPLRSHTLHRAKPNQRSLTDVSRSSLRHTRSALHVALPYIKDRNQDNTDWRQSWLLVWTEHISLGACGAFWHLGVCPPSSLCLWQAEDPRNKAWTWVRQARWWGRCIRESLMEGAILALVLKSAMTALPLSLPDSLCTSHNPPLPSQGLTRNFLLSDWETLICWGAVLDHSSYAGCWIPTGASDNWNKYQGIQRGQLVHLAPGGLARLKCKSSCYKPKSLAFTSVSWSRSINYLKSVNSEEHSLEMSA